MGTIRLVRYHFQIRYLLIEKLLHIANILVSKLIRSHPGKTSDGFLFCKRRMCNIYDGSCELFISYMVPHRVGWRDNFCFCLLNNYVL
jgi:hypothetical protein